MLCKERERERERELAKRCERTEFFVRRFLIHLIAYIFHFFSISPSLKCSVLLSFTLPSTLTLSLSHSCSHIDWYAQAQQSQKHFHSQFFGSAAATTHHERRTMKRQRSQCVYLSPFEPFWTLYADVFFSALRSVFLKTSIQCMLQIFSMEKKARNVYNRKDKRFKLNMYVRNWTTWK